MSKRGAIGTSMGAATGKSTAAKRAARASAMRKRKAIEAKGPATAAQHAAIAALVAELHVASQPVSTRASASVEIGRLKRIEHERNGNYRTTILPAAKRRQPTKYVSHSELRHGRKT